MSEKDEQLVVFDKPMAERTIMYLERVREHVQKTHEDEELKKIIFTLQIISTDGKTQVDAKKPVVTNDPNVKLKKPKPEWDGPSNGNFLNGFIWCPYFSQHQIDTLIKPYGRVNSFGAKLVGQILHKALDIPFSWNGDGIDEATNLLNGFGWKRLDPFVKSKDHGTRIGRFLSDHATQKTFLPKEVFEMLVIALDL